MSGARRLILDRVKAALARLPAKSPLPEYPADVTVSLGARAPGSLIDRFRERLEGVHGRSFTDRGALETWLVAVGATRGYCDPALAPWLTKGFLGGAVTLETTLERDRIDDYQFGITRAWGAIAETGTLILDDGTTSRRLGALAPWIHVGVVTPDRLFPDLRSAIAALGPDPNVVLCTGPSKTADVEGILIEGVHGPGEQVALLRL